MKTLVSPDSVRGERLLHGGPPSDEECPAVILDFDGVLAVEGPLGPEPRRLGLEILAEALSLGLKVYIVSGRREADRPVVERLLAEAGAPAGRLAGVVLRSSRKTEVDHKLDSILRVEAREGCVAEMHDDNPYVLHSVRRHVKAGVLHHGEQCTVLYGVALTSKCSPEGER
ncbi:MAG: HAD family hydrolase [Aeropyrum sp.]|nr:HAD family hydrolase [Aeropyrum sp.]MCE4616461.1 HAD family hydrolase [Aeropyrum sp.]